MREERAGDADAIASVVAAAFGSPAEAALVEAIRASDGYIEGLSLVAELDERGEAFVVLEGDPAYYGTLDGVAHD